jgi:hypothetical protein
LLGLKGNDILVSCQIDKLTSSFNHFVLVFVERRVFVVGLAKARDMAV